MSKWINEDISHIVPEEVKTEDQGKGIYYAALGKEIDEHNILKRRENKGVLIIILIFLGFVILGAFMTFAPLLQIDYTFKKAIETKNEEYKTEYRDSSGNIWKYKPIQKGDTDGPK